MALGTWGHPLQRKERLSQHLHPITKKEEPYLVDVSMSGDSIFHSQEYGTKSYARQRSPFPALSKNQSRKIMYSTAVQVSLSLK